MSFNEQEQAAQTSGGLASFWKRNIVSVPLLSPLTVTVRLAHLLELRQLFRSQNRR